MSRVKSFRLSDTLLADLAVDSHKSGVSVNSHVIQILESYNKSYRHLERMHYFWFSPRFIEEVVKIADDAQLKKISEILTMDLIKEIRYSKGELNSRSIINLIEENCNVQRIPFSAKIINGSTRYTIIHGISHKWNILFKETLKNLLDTVNTKVENIAFNTDHITFSIQHNDLKSYPVKKDHKKHLHEVQK